MIRYVDLVEDTICAPITAPGQSGVAVIRVSGNKALAMTKKLCPLLPDNMESHKIYLGTFKEWQTGKHLDQVLVSFFAQGQSFTGDEVVEISCHGNPVVVNSILHQYLNLGSRSAERGEFSFRAFFNGKIDLVQAESIQALVGSQTSVGLRTFSQTIGRKYFCKILRDRKPIG